MKKNILFTDTSDHKICIFPNTTNAINLIIKRINEKKMLRYFITWNVKTFCKSRLILN